MNEPANDVLRLGQCDPSHLIRLLSRFGLVLRVVDEGETIHGSYWGDEEAGLVGDHLVARADSPLHSVLHEACHYVCMDAGRRDGLHTDAGGDYDEENGVCYLQILLADEIDGFGRSRMMRDMDTWGYSFRLGSARAWFERDAEDTRQWLTRHGLLDEAGRPTFRLRLT
ncbi:MAG: hypothetical protein HKO85_01205 [Xanthomonadales bacterium]|nr:hypothetical protein [Gammaproteobacteria bacterium]MBT8050731.1 hypothetical protein [Gammaproteobacteria bacterium]MBT8055555.1 hypothetical protein [Gammaproteobacteria bacterium]NNJ78230.1 hypothetical protein [Xanthomonadales bacterium]NNL03874.1 hypothetical protein [Xanthomonadales bacterium]